MELLWRTGTGAAPFIGVVPIPGNHSRRLLPARVTITAEEYNRRENRRIKHERIRRKLEGTSTRPRLAVFRSNQHLYCQVIDDSKMHTLAAMSTIQKPLRDELNLTSGPTIAAAKRVGEEIAKLCLTKGITKVAFDRGGFEYHGRIKALAEAARESGLEF